uniref:CHHC U11-48K-type domain-containing protein n=1 Tax=Amphiprion percula TaxID=161767 RepID=A0A3P8SB64_AMPPE
HMATYRFGTTSSPSRTATEGRAQPAEESDVKDDADPNRLLQCPYDKSHQIRASRFPYHIIKCRKNHPELASELRACPFNARHLVPKHELAHHTETCENRPSGDSQDEVDNDAAPFVWSVDKTFTQEQKSKPSKTPAPRAPNTLPWDDEQ